MAVEGKEDIKTKTNTTCTLELIRICFKTLIESKTTIKYLLPFLPVYTSILLTGRKT